ncbi:MAG: hypothetical protein KA371_11610 [Acidobacteria bacterium]|nr:hypothetical protein [Acidobacteriota bacterium]
MPRARLLVLGLSAPTLTMIFDNLESCGEFPDVHVVNNLARVGLEPFAHPRFSVTVSQEGVHPGGPSDAFLGVNKPASKHAVFTLFDGCGLVFATIVHRSAAIASTATLGAGVHVNSLVSVAGHTSLGRFVSLNRNVSVGHHALVGEFATVNPGANLAGFVTIGARTLIGMGVNVLDGVTVGADAVIGAGSLVTRDIPPGVVACGQPCRIVRENKTAAP